MSSAVSDSRFTLGMPEPHYCCFLYLSVVPFSSLQDKCSASTHFVHRVALCFVFHRSKPQAKDSRRRAVNSARKRNQGGAGITPWVKGLPSQHEDLTSNLALPRKSLVYTCVTPAWGQRARETGGFGSSLANCLAEWMGSGFKENPCPKGRWHAIKEDRYLMSFHRLAHMCTSTFKCVYIPQPYTHKQINKHQMRKLMVKNEWPIMEGAGWLEVNSTTFESGKDETSNQ